MTSEEKWQFVCDEIQKLKDRVAKIEGYAESRVKNKQGVNAHRNYDPSESEDDGYTVEQMEREYKPVEGIDK